MVRTLSKEALNITNQRLLQVLKAFENARESQFFFRMSSGPQAIRTTRSNQ